MANLVAGQSISISGRGTTLQRVEALSADEKAELVKAEVAVAKASADLEAVKAKIAVAHKMGRESWMEWSSWYEFDGDFILFRFLSNMGTNSSLDK